jgi:hypothetical protein
VCLFGGKKVHVTISVFSMPHFFGEISCAMASELTECRHFWNSLVVRFCESAASQSGHNMADTRSSSFAKSIINLYEPSSLTLQLI